MRFKFIWAAVLAMSGAVSVQATPVTWVDTIDVTPDRYISTDASFSYVHNILDDGYTPSIDAIYGYSLSVNLFDDNKEGLEVALVDVPGLLGDRVFFNLSGAEYGGWSLAGQTQLNETGAYAVTITSLIGGFFIGSSTLTVRGEDNGHSVPEPGTLSLLGLGLLGVGAGLRRKKAVR